MGSADLDASGEASGPTEGVPACQFFPALNQSKSSIERHGEDVCNCKVL